MFDIEKEIVKANHAYMATFWQGHNAAACSAPFDAARTQAWQLGYRYFEKDNSPRILNRSRDEIDTSAEDKRLDDPRHETGSNR